MEGWIILPDCIIKEIKNVCLKNRNRFSIKELLIDLENFNREKLEKLDYNLWTFYQNEIKFLEPTTLNRALNKRKKDNGVYFNKTSHLLDFLAYYAFQKNWVTTLKQLGINENEVLWRTKKEFEPIFILKGAELINEDYKNKALNSNNNYTVYDYYLSKINEQCQWYGIFEGLDVVRLEFAFLRENVLNSFKKNRISKVSAVVYGMGGVGKSTILRRLAASLIEESFKIIWINNFELFCSIDLIGLKSLVNNQFLLIIEDWEKVIHNKSSVNQFFYELRNIDNIRVVIGDREVGNKEYMEYLYGNCLIQLTNEENGNILKNIVNRCPNWEKALTKMQIEGNLNNLSLYIQLFILARQSSSQSDNLPDLNDVFSEFKYIINRDFNILMKSEPDIVKAIYYTACLYNKFKFTFLSSSFEIIYNYFKTNQNRLSHDFLLDYPLLTYYLSLSRFNYHPIYKNQYLLTFNHDLLLSEGLIHLCIDGIPPYNENTEQNIFKALIEGGDIKTALEIASSIDKKSATKSLLEILHNYYEKLLELVDTSSDFAFNLTMTFTDLYKTDLKFNKAFTLYENSLPLRKELCQKINDPTEQLIFDIKGFSPIICIIANFYSYESGVKILKKLIDMNSNPTILYNYHQNIINKPYSYNEYEPFLDLLILKCYPDGIMGILPIEFIKSVFIKKVSELPKNYKLLGIIANGITFLGCCLNGNDDWSFKGNEFDKAINTLTSLKKYSETANFQLNIIKEANTSGLCVLEESYIDFSIDEIYISFENACNEVIKFDFNIDNKIYHPFGGQIYFTAYS